MPDVVLLLDLCNELDTTADTLLNGGVAINKKRRLVKVENIVNGFEHLLLLKDCFGEESTFYKGIVEGISSKMNFDFAEALANNAEVLYAEVVIQYLQNGYTVDIEEARKWITDERYINEIQKRIK